MKRRESLVETLMQGVTMCSFQSYLERSKWRRLRDDSIEECREKCYRKPRKEEISISGALS